MSILFDQFGKPLSLSQHNSIEHTIGEEIPAPTLIFPGGLQTTASSLGTSSVPAREDHVHGANAAYRVKVRRTAVMAAATGTNVPILWDDEEYDTFSSHSTSSNTERLIASIDGLYLAGYQFFVGAGLASANVIAAWLELSSGTSLKKAFSQHSPNSGSGTIITGSDIVSMAANDYLTMYCFHNFGSTISVAGSPTTFWMTRLGSY